MKKSRFDIISDLFKLSNVISPSMTASCLRFIPMK